MIPPTIIHPNPQSWIGMDWMGGRLVSIDPTNDSCNMIDFCLVHQETHNKEEYKLYLVDGVMQVRQL